MNATLAVIANTTVVESNCGNTDEGIQAKWLIGVVSCVLGSFMTCSGMVLQKLAHMRNDELPVEERRPEVAGLLCSPMWWLGFFLLTALCIPGDLVAMALTPQSVLAPLSGVTIVLCQIVAPIVLKTERVTRLDWMASICIVVGCGATTASGSQCSEEYTLDQLLDLFTNAPFIIHEVLVVLMIVGLMLMIWFGIPSLVGPEQRHRYVAVCWSLLAGLFAGQSNMTFKVVGEVMETTAGGDNSAWGRPYVYMFMVGLLITATGQMSCMNKALQVWTAVKVSPMYFASLILFSTMSGTILFEEYKQITTVGAVVFPIALILVLGSILLLTRKDEKVVPEEEPAKSEGPDLEGQTPGGPDKQTPKGGGMVAVGVDDFCKVSEEPIPGDVQIIDISAEPDEAYAKAVGISAEPDLPNAVEMPAIAHKYAVS